MRIAKPVRELGTRAPWLHEGGVRAVEIARDGNILTLGEGQARRWMLATGEMALTTERGPRDGQMYDGYLLPEIERLVGWFRTDDDRYSFRTWDLRTGAFLGEVAAGDFPDRALLAVDRDGRRALLTTGDERAEPALVSIEDGSLLGRLETGCERAAFLSTGEIIGPDIGGEIRIWTAEGTSPRSFVPPRPPPPDFTEPGMMRVNGIYASRTHPLFAVVYDYRLAVFRTDGTELFEVADHYAPIAFSPSGERIAMNASGRVVLYDLAGKERGAISTDATPLDSFAIGLDHRLIVGAQSSGELHARSTSSALPSPGAAPRKATVLPGEISSITGGPDGTTIAFSCASGDVLLWKEGEDVPRRLPGTGRSSATLRWLPNGKLLVDTVYTFRVISPETHEVWAEMTIPGNNLSPDGRLGASIGGGGRLLLFETETGAVRADHLLEGVPVPVPTGSFVWTNESNAIANDGSVCRIEKNDVVVFDPLGKIRLRASLERFTPALPESGHGYWRQAFFLSDGEILIADTLSGLHLLDLATNTWKTLVAELALSVTAIDFVRRRVAIAAPLESTGEWGSRIFDIDTAAVLIEVPSGARYARNEFLANGSLVTSTPDRRIVVWEAP